MGRWQEMTDRVMKTCRDTFTTEFVYLPRSGGSHAMTGIFDKAHAEVLMIDGAPVSSVYPKMGVRNLDLPVTPGPGDRLTVNGITYRVDESRPDGEAGTVLILDEVPPAPPPEEEEGE